MSCIIGYITDGIIDLCYNNRSKHNVTNARGFYDYTRKGRDKGQINTAFASISEDQNAAFLAGRTDRTRAEAVKAAVNKVSIGIICTLSVAALIVGALGTATPLIIAGGTVLGMEAITLLIRYSCRDTKSKYCSETPRLSIAEKLLIPNPNS